MPILFFMALSADPVTPESLQHASIISIFQGLYEAFDGIINFANPVQDVRYSVPLYEGMVLTRDCFLLFKSGSLQTFTVKWWDFLSPDLSIDFLPQSVEILDITMSGQKFILKTRLLPRDARYINLSQNRMKGTVDLSCLPRYLETFNLSQNVDLKGRIALVGFRNP